MKIQVYKCRFTDKLFTLNQKEDYILHLKELREEFKERRLKVKREKRFQTWLAAEKEKIVSIDMIVPWILENQQRLMKDFNIVGKSTFWDKFHPKSDKIEKIDLQIKYNSNTSNSHSCPRNGKLNWCARNPGPTGYPGFEGHLKGFMFRLPRHQGSYPLSDFFKMIDIHTESGSGINEGFHWNVKIFLSDWPGLAQELVFNKLKG